MINRNIRLILKKDFLIIKRGHLNDIIFIFFMALICSIPILLVYGSFIELPVNDELLSTFGLKPGDNNILLILSGVQFMSFFTIIGSQLWFLYIINKNIWFTSEKSNFIIFSKLKINYYDIFKAKYLLSKVISSSLLIVYTFIAFIFIIQSYHWNFNENSFQIKVHILSILYLYFLWDSILVYLLHRDFIKNNINNNRRFWVGNREFGFMMFFIVSMLLMITQSILQITGMDNYIITFSIIVVIMFLINMFFHLRAFKLKKVTAITYKGVNYEND